MKFAFAVAALAISVALFFPLSWFATFMLSTFGLANLWAAGVAVAVFCASVKAILEA